MLASPIGVQCTVHQACNTSVGWGEQSPLSFLLTFSQAFQGEDSNATI